MVVVVESGRRANSPYDFKPSPYSSHSALLAYFPAPGNAKRVLDVGSGPGYLAAILAERGYDVTGLEAPGRTGDAFPPNVRLIECNLDSGLPQLASHFDSIVCADVLEHVREPAALLSLLRERLEPGGRVLASLPNSGHAYFRWNVLCGRFPQHEKGLFDRTHLHFYTWPGWRDLFASAGFRIEAVRPTGVPVNLALPSLEGTALVRVLERLSFELARLRKPLFAYQFVVSARPE
jgi:SAM-dependent methyltransferase